MRICSGPYWICLIASTLGGRLWWLLGNIGVATIRGDVTLRRHAVLRLLLWVTAAIRSLLVHIGNAVARGWCIAIGSRWCSVAAAASASIPSAVAVAESSATGTIIGCLINTNSSPVKLDIVHSGDGSLGISFLYVSHKTKATAAAGISILDNHRFLNHAKLLKLLAQSGLFGVPC